MTYARDPYDTDQPPCFCDEEGGPVFTTQEYCAAHGDPAKPAPEPITAESPATLDDAAEQIAREERWT